MADHENATSSVDGESDAQAAKPELNIPAWIGPVVTFGGAISYFLYFFQFPDLRDFPWVNLPLVALGVVVSLFGLRRVLTNGGYGFLSKAMASIGFLFSAALASLFVFYIFSFSFQMPGADGVSQVGDAAPAFSLLNHDNETVKLDDFREKKLVIAFYRGHW